MPVMLCRVIGVVVAAILSTTAPVCAQTDMPAEDRPSAGVPVTVYANADLAGVDGEPSWLHGGFGKLRFGGRAPGSEDRFAVRPHLTEAGIALQPHLTWSLGATIVGVAQAGRQHAFDLSEGFLSFKPLPVGNAHLSFRGGLFWPPVSLEHGGAEWAVRDTITPSAINAWIGEEVKVAGVEGTASTMVGNHRLAFTGSLFGGNDTSGTLIAFRGWALHDEKATAFGLQRLPTLNAFMQHAQAPETRPVIELDNRPGYYAKLAWTPPGPLEIQAFRYDNRGDPEAVDANLQWGWRTRFDHLGLVLDLDPQTRLSAQGMIGRTLMGYPKAGRRWVDTRFRSAFVLATHTITDRSVSVRAEAFDTDSRGSEAGPDDSENGWAVTVAARTPLTSFATLALEAAHVDSRREARLRDGLDPRQQQTLVRLQLRLRASR